MEIINILEAGFSGWCNEEGVRQAISLIKNVIEVLRIVVPIGLVLMTSLDVAKKVINPEEKDGQKKIMRRLLAAVLVFLVPLMIKLVFKLIDVGKESSGSYNSGVSSCWGEIVK